MHHLVRHLVRRIERARCARAPSPGFFLAPLAALLLACLLASAPGTARAAEEPTQGGSQELSNPFSDFVPFEDEYDLDEDERFMYFGRFFAVGLGTGMQKWTGNIGKLYNTALPVADFRLTYFFDFRLAGQIGFTTSSHAFDAAPVGPTTVSFLRLNGDLKYYFNTKNVGAAITSANPYVIAGVAQTFRTQAYERLGSVQKDASIGVSGGGGIEFTLKPRKSAFGIEARMHQTFFKDRHEQTFKESNVEDLTGNMVSLMGTLTWFF